MLALEQGARGRRHSQTAGDDAAVRRSHRPRPAVEDDGTRWGRPSRGFRTMGKLVSEKMRVDAMPSSAASRSTPVHIDQVTGLDSTVVDVFK